MSELMKRKAEDTFRFEIEVDGRRLTSAARRGKITIVEELLSTNMVDINMWSEIGLNLWSDGDWEENFVEEEYYITTTP